MKSRPEEYNHRVLLVCIGGYYLLVLMTNLLVTYPIDNDLDEIGWLAANLDLSRPESLANANYPFGLPLLLKLLTPVFGGLLPAALVVQSTAAAVTLYFSFRASHLLFGSVEAAYIGLTFTSVLIFESAISEFADGLCTMFVYAGLFFLVLRHADLKGFFVLGLCVGAAYLFRYHYLSFFLFICVASLALHGSWTDKWTRPMIFAIGVLLMASPQLTFNYLSHGHFFSHPFQGYLIGINVHDSLDWGDFLGTYSLWPVDRLLDETPWSEIFLHMIGTTGKIFQDMDILLALAVLPLVLSTAKDAFSKRIVWIVFLSAVLYAAIIIAPTHYSNRAILPVTVLSGIFIGAALTVLARYTAKTLRPLLFVAFIPAILYFVTPLTYNLDLIRDKHEHMQQNRAILEILKQGGKEKSAEVYTDDWRVFPLDDPEFITYHNHGGWLLLDSKYARERPNPLRVNGLRQWARFFRQHNLRFAVLSKDEQRYAEFYRDKLPAPWKRLGESDDHIIVKFVD